MENTKQKKSFTGYFKSFGKYFSQRLKGNIAMTVFMALYAAFCIGSIIYFAVIGYWRDCGIGFVYFVIALLVYFLEYSLHVRSPLPYTIFILVYCAFCYLGCSYNFYTLIPMLDDILHACWGILFTSLGFCVIKSLMGEPESAKQFIAYLLFGIGFCMILAIIWEIYEYACDCLFPSYDMQEDVIVDHIHSFMLHVPYDHLHTLQIDGIAYTQIFDKDGNLLYTVEGGYLDIGLNDTMMDIIWCFVATSLLGILLAADRKLGGKLYPHIIPVYVGKEDKAEAEERENAQESAEETDGQAAQNGEEQAQTGQEEGDEPAQNAQSQEIFE